MKKIVVVLLFASSLFSATIKNNWTINLFKANSMKEVNSILNSKLNKPKKDIYIFMQKNKYVVTYGVFPNYLTASKFLQKEKKALGLRNPYVLMTKYNLKQKKIPNLVKVIKYGTKAIALKPKVVEEKKEQEPKQEEEVSQKPKKVVKRDYTFAISLEYANNNLSGDLKTKGNGSKVDFENDLGLDKADQTLIPKLSMKIDKHKVSFSHYANKVSNQQVLTNDIIVDGFTYTTGSNVNSSFNLRSTTLGYRYDYNSFDIGIDYLMFENNIDISTHAKTINIDGEYNLIILAVDKKVDIANNRFAFGAGLGMGSDIDYMRYNLAYEYPMTSDMDLSAGYEAKQMDIDSKSYDSSMDFNKFFIKFNKTF